MAEFKRTKLNIILATIYEIPCKHDGNNFIFMSPSVATYYNQYIFRTRSPYISATALKDMAAAANSPGSSPDEYKAHIENYFASKLIPGAPSTRYYIFF